MAPDILVNGRSLTRCITGIERYTTEILRCLRDRVRVVQPHINYQGIAGHAWEQLTLPRYATPQSILWSPANTGPVVISNQVLTLHDLSPLEHPEWYRPAFAVWYRLFLPLLVRRVRCILTLSRHVRSKIIARFNLPAERVIAIPAGVDATRFNRLSSPGSLGRYILFVGSLQPRKNISALLSAWMLIEKQHPQVSLILAGTVGRVFRQEVFSHDMQRVHFAGYVPESALPGLYAGAEAFILPSLDEGFGLPVLEAMACGTPVVASWSGALPEVVGDAGLLCDPSDPAAMAGALDEYLRDADLRHFMSERGQQRAAQFSWQASAEQVWQTLRGSDGC